MYIRHFKQASAKVFSELGDFAAAAMYFGRMSSTFGETGWNNVETTMLKMYAQCMKKLNRKDEYVRTLLEILAKSAASKRSLRKYQKGEEREGAVQTPKDWVNDDLLNTSGIFQELVTYSQHLPYDVNVQMAKYFNDIVVEPYVRHFDEKDGFQLRLQFRHLLEDGVELDKAKVHLIDASSAQGKDIWLESTEVAQIKKGLCRMWLSSNVCTSSMYASLSDLIRLTRRGHTSWTRSFSKPNESSSCTNPLLRLKPRLPWVSLPRYRQLH